MAEHHYTEPDAEGGRRYGKEVSRGKLFDMIVEKGFPVP
jgi:hypothetical protein